MYDSAAAVAYVRLVVYTGHADHCQGSVVSTPPHTNCSPPNNIVFGCYVHGLFAKPSVWKNAPSPNTKCNGKYTADGGIRYRYGCQIRRFSPKQNGVKTRNRLIMRDTYFFAVCHSLYSSYVYSCITIEGKNM